MVQNIDGPAHEYGPLAQCPCPIHLHAKIKILMGHLEKKMGLRNVNIHLTANEHHI